MAERSSHDPLARTGTVTDLGTTLETAECYILSSFPVLGFNFFFEPWEGLVVII